MIPGPIELEPEVLAEMGKPLVAHYGREWAQFFKETVELLKRVMLAQRARVYLIVGPGSAALDAAIGNTITACAAGEAHSEGKILVLSNGFFGERLRQIACSYLPQDRVVVLGAPLGEPIDPQRVEEALKRESAIRVVTLVHCETSTGVLNPVCDIAQICRSHEAISIVDAVSSLGGAELRFDEWGIDILVSATQKGLECPPGLAPLAISHRAWELIKSGQSRGWYLNLRTWQRYLEEWGEWHPHPVTMPSGLMQALHLSLSKIIDEGLEERWGRHERIARLLRKGLSALGLKPLAPEGYASPTVTAAWAHERMEAERLLKYLKERHGIMIAGGLAELAGKTIRIGHMGPTARLDGIIPLLFGIEEALREAGVPIEAGKSLQSLEV
jgi:aspartate aminotransferase-like enzyme